METEPLEMLRRLDEVLKRKELGRMIPASQSTLSLWLSEKAPINARSGKVIRMIYDSLISCLDRLEK